MNIPGHFPWDAGIRPTSLAANGRVPDVPGAGGRLDEPRLRLSGGSVSLDLGLGATLMAYITTGVGAAAGVVS